MGICGSKTQDVAQTPGGLASTKRQGSFKCVDGQESGRYRSVVVAGLPNVMFEFTGNDEERNWWAKIDQFLEQQQCLKRQILRSLEGSIVIFIFAVKASRAELEMLTDKIASLFPELDSVRMRPMRRTELLDSKRLFPKLYKEILDVEFQALEEDRICIAEYLDQIVTTSRVYSHFFDDDKDHASPLRSAHVYRFLKAVVVQIFQKLEVATRDDLVFASEDIDEIIEEMKENLPQNRRNQFTTTEFRTYCKWLSKYFQDVLDTFEKKYCRTRSPSDLI